MTATLLPNAKQQFLDTNGRPLAGGQVYFYIPNTSTFKSTWQDAGETTLNTNPVVLDSNGQAIIYGDGQYRQVVYDVHGNLIWDRLTASPALNSEFQSFVSNIEGASGSSLIGYTASGTGAVVRTLLDKVREFPTLEDFGAKGDGVTNDTTAVQDAINHGGCIWAKAGTYIISSVSFIGKSVILIGDGEDKTIFKATGTGVMFDVQETSDQALLPLALMSMKLDGSGTATAGIKLRYRHQTVLQNVTITNVLGDALNELDSWNNTRNSVTLRDCTNGLVLQGANNNSQYNGLSLSGHSQYQIKILNGGTVAGGSTGLSFNRCDAAYAPGFGVYVNTHGVVRFNDCYIGEQIQGTVFDMASGMVVMNGGFGYFGTTATSYLGNLQGGKLYFQNVSITGGASATVSNMFYKQPTWTGHAYVEDSPCFITVASPQVMVGDVLDYGRVFDCFAPKLGRLYTPFTLNGTNTSSSTENEITVTCSTVTGSPCIMEVKAQVTEGWLRGQAGSFIVIYSSQKDLTVRLTNGSVGITPDDNIGTLPATGGVVKTAVVFDWVYNNNDTPWLEIFQLNTVVGDTFTVYEVFLYDFKQGKADSAATFYNLGKS